MALTAAPQLDRYEVVEEIGRGAMGTVYLAQDSLIGRLVALKSLNAAEGLDVERLKELRQASLSEAQAGGMLSHPNIVTIHDVVESSDGSLPLIAMEYVRGTNLREMLRGGRRLPKDFLLAVVSQVASALDYAHQKGVIHGDVKPANILITEEEQVKLTDFGIARLERSAKKGSKRFLGTPKYVAPEQVLRKEVDHRADIFALGVVVFEMLCGRPPFDGKTSAEIINRVAHEPFELPESFEDDLGPEVVKVLESALHKDSAQRYQHAGDLAADLRLAISGADSADTQDLSAHLPGRPTDELPFWLAKIKLVISRLQREKIIWWRVLTVSLLASLVGLGWFGGSLWKILHWREIEGTVSPAEHRQRLEVLPELQAGATLLRAGRPDEALQVLERATAQAPAIYAAARLHQRAGREAQELMAYRQLEEEIQSLLTEGRAALARGRLAAVNTVAERVLLLDPERAEAKKLIEQTRARQTRARRVTPPPITRIAVPPTPISEQEIARAASQEPQPPPPPNPGPALPATLRVDFFSHLPKGVLTIYSGKQQVLLERFRFLKKSGLLRRRGISGRLERVLELPAGQTTLRIYVASEGKRTRSKSLAVTLEAGKTRVLRIAVSTTGETRVDLG